jgi:hypothetical protein
MWYVVTATSSWMRRREPASLLWHRVLAVLV